jgi:ferredoxin-thioredoxin reductase catalytic chain
MELLFEEYKQYAKEMDVQLNQDNEIVKLIFQGLINNSEKYGRYYCPCKLQKIDDNICICKDMRENKKCCCKLFV